MSSIHHVIHVWVKERTKQFIEVSVPVLHARPGDTVEWRATDGQGPFSIEFDKSVDSKLGSPLPEAVTDSGRMHQVRDDASKTNYEYTIYMKNDRSLYLDPSIVIDQP